MNRSTQDNPIHPASLRSVYLETERLANKAFDAPDTFTIEDTRALAACANTLRTELLERDSDLRAAKHAERKTIRNAVIDSDDLRLIASVLRADTKLSTTLRDRWSTFLNKIQSRTISRHIAADIIDALSLRKMSTASATLHLPPATCDTCQAPLFTTSGTLDQPTRTPGQVTPPARNTATPTVELHSSLPRRCPACAAPTTKAAATPHKSCAGLALVPNPPGQRGDRDSANERQPT